ncbi:MAG: metallophosphoesterase family protein [Gemmatimonadetes bacterium]|nr:metallophosphoesterase family protein [Gemmatimonadota bacterium]
MKIGIISDTHGLLRAQVFEVFAGVDHILHAGDVGDDGILDELAAIAPVTAVWGNVDGWEVRKRVPEVAEIELGGIPVVVVHGMQLGSPTPEKVAAAYPRAALAVFGHSHQPVIRRVGATLAVNPGSAGRQRFRDPVSVALAEIADGEVTAHLVDLDPSRK